MGGCSDELQVAKDLQMSKASGKEAEEADVLHPPRGPGGADFLAGTLRKSTALLTPFSWPRETHFAL